MKNRIQTSQNKFKHFCLQLDKMAHISHKKFETLNWLILIERFNQWINLTVSRCVNVQCFIYLNEVFQSENKIQIRTSFQKLKCPFHKTNSGQMTSSYIGLIIWINTLDTLKRTKVLNTFKHDLKEHCI